MHSQMSQTTWCFLNSLIIKGIKFSTPSLHACMASAISTLKTQIINHAYSRKQHIISTPWSTSTKTLSSFQSTFIFPIQNWDWVNNQCKAKSKTNCREKIKIDYKSILYKNFYFIKMNYRQCCFLRSKLLSHENGRYCGVVDENW